MSGMGRGTPRVNPTSEPEPAPSGTTATTTTPFVVDRTVHLASQVLPAAGAFTAQPMESVPLGTKFLTYVVTYTRGAAGGYPVFRHESTNGVETNVREPLQNDSSLVVAQPDGAVDVVMEEIDGPAPADGDPIVFYLRYELMDGATAARLLVAEKGDPANPGTVAIARTGSGGG
jgi:hypothetical protein